MESEKFIFPGVGSSRSNRGKESTEIYSPKKDIDLRKAHDDRLYTKLKYTFDLENCRRESIIRSLDKLSNVKRHSFHLWKDNYIKILLDISCEFFGNMSFFES
jgi:hypothetical protein